MNTIRPSFAEREAFRNILGQAYAEGRLDDDEFAARQDLLERGTTIGDLEGVVDGLPTGDLDLPGPHPSTAPAVRRPVSWTRRGLLGAGAAAVGFVAAGGLGKAAELVPRSGSLPVPGAKINCLVPGGLDKPLRWLKAHRYTRFTDLSLHDNLFTANAVVPGRRDAYDRVTITGTESSARPGGTVDENELVFGLDDVALDLIPEFARVAGELVGGKCTYVIVDGWEGAVAVRPYISGDAYGAGSAYLVWSSDGKKLIRIVR